MSKFQGFMARCGAKASGLKKIAINAVAASAVIGGAAMADASDPTSTFVSTLGTYAVDVGLLAVAVLGIYYGKKLVGYLKV
ncbi:hypothetical protein [Dyella humicola]|uniref:hypothetical protein n=1 Tax=Dyella humicola TaxID=2992126 RepID=UPI00225554CD|nr:hypothetical protein [Dyella humicola]